MEIFKVIVTLMGVLMSLAYYPQAYKIWKNKSAANISISTFVVFALGTLTWLIYGVLVKDVVIIAGFGVGVVGSWTVLTLSILYKK